MKAPKQNHASTFIISVVLLTGGLVLALVQDLTRLPITVMAMCTPVSHPGKPDFSHYDALLKSVVKDGRVDYKKAKDSQLLSAALQELATTGSDKFTTPSDSFCYWLNAHNLLSIKLICDHYPIPTLFPVRRNFISSRFIVGGQAMSIEEIWTDQIRQRLLGGDKKIEVPGAGVFLICRGSRGYPHILDHATTAASMVKDIDTNADAFLHDPANVDYRPDVLVFKISQFFSIYREVCCQGFEDPWEFVIYHLDKDDKEPLDPRLEKKYLAVFDWKLNDLK